MQESIERRAAKLATPEPYLYKNAGIVLSALLELRTVSREERAPHWPITFELLGTCEPDGRGDCERVCMAAMRAITDPSVSCEEREPYMPILGELMMRPVNWVNQKSNCKAFLKACIDVIGNITPKERAPYLHHLVALATNLKDTHRNRTWDAVNCLTNRRKVDSITAEEFSPHADTVIEYIRTWEARSGAKGDLRPQLKLALHHAEAFSASDEHVMFLLDQYDSHPNYTDLRSTIVKLFGFLPKVGTIWHCLVDYLACVCTFPVDQTCITPSLCRQDECNLYPGYNS